MSARKVEWEDQRSVSVCEAGRGFPTMVVVVLESASNTVNTDMMGCFTASITKIFVLSFAFFYTEMIGIHHRDKRYTKVRRFLLIYLLLSNYER